MKILIGNVWYSTPEGSSIKINRAMSDPVPTATVNFRDNTSAFNIIAPQEMLILDDQIIPNPAINYLKNPDMNPDNSFWSIGTPAGITTSQASPGGIIITTNNTAAATNPITQQETDPTLLRVQSISTYVFSVFAQGSVGNTNIKAYMAVQWKDVNNLFISSSTFTGSAPVPTSLTRYSIQATPPSNAFYANVQLGVVTTSGTNSGTITYTDAQLEPLWFSTIAYPTPFCGPSQASCQQLPHNPLWIRQYRKFAGLVVDVAPVDYHGNARTIQVKAAGYAWLAGLAIGPDQFSGQVDNTIIGSLLSTYFLSNGVQLCSTTNVVAGVTLSNFQLNWDDLRTAFDSLCAQSGYYWTIDYYWNFIYAPPGYFSMMISLICDNSSVPDMVNTFPAYNFRGNSDFTQPGSTILVLGNGTNTAKIIDPAQTANLGAISGYTLPTGSSWMRKVNDSTLYSVADCTQRGMAELLQFDYARGLFHLDTNVELIAGQGVRVTSNTDGLSQTTLLIQQITASWIGTSETLTDTWDYSADLGSTNRAATNIISRLFRRTNTNTSAVAIATTTLAVLENLSITDTEAQGVVVSNYAQTILADTPIAYYRLAEITGTIADDISGNANQGTIVNSPTLGVTTLLNDAADSSDKAITFASGSSQDITLPTAMIPTGAHAWSLECWFKITAIPANATHQTLMGWGASSGNQKFGVLNLASNGTNCQLVCSTNNGDITSANLSTNTTYHAVGTYDGTNTRLYLNGSLVAGPTPFTLSLTATMAQIGSYTGYSTSFFSGTIDEVAFYTFALSGTQVTTHHNAGI